MLNKTELRELIEATRLSINLREAAIEKDYYVTQVIHKLSDIENEHFRLVFCGGTCLAKAHKLVQRMSEDVDFKVQLKSGINLNKSQLKNELKEFRAKVRSAFVFPDLVILNDRTRNEGRYQHIALSYPNTYQDNASLRPEIKVEFTYANIQLEISKLQIKTLIEDTLKEVTLFAPPETRCISVEETATEKWVALTRRIMAIKRGYETDDTSLIRHVYDINAILKANKVNSQCFELAKTIIAGDASQFKNKQQEYAANPGYEIKQSLLELKNNPIWHERYNEFLENMVYDNSDTLPYHQAIASLDIISDKILQGL